MKQKKYSSLQGSVLAYTLIILAILMITAVGLLTSTMSNMRSALSTDKSATAFQSADSATQAVSAALKALQKEMKYENKLINDVFSGSLGSCSSSGVVTLNAITGAQVELLDRNDKVLKCDAHLSCVEAAKSVGTSMGTARAVYAPRIDRSRYGISCTETEDTTGKKDTSCVVVDNRTSKVRVSTTMKEPWKDYDTSLDPPFNPTAFTTYGVSYLGKDEVCVIDQKTSEVMCSTGGSSTWIDFGKPFIAATTDPNPKTTYDLSCSKRGETDKGVCCVIDQKTSEMKCKTSGFWSSSYTISSSSGVIGTYDVDDNPFEDEDKNVYKISMADIVPCVYNITGGVPKCLAIQGLKDLTDKWDYWSDMVFPFSGDYNNKSCFVDPTESEEANRKIGCIGISFSGESSETSWMGSDQPFGPLDGAQESAISCTDGFCCAINGKTSEVKCIYRGDLASTWEHRGAFPEDNPF